MLPKISIITPCLNSEATLERAIQHLIAQNYPNLEYIIIDGNSKDGTIEIIKKYQQHIHIWVSEPDSGTSEAINKGIARANGDIVGFLLSDDVYEANALNTIAKAFQQQPQVNIFYGDINYIGPFRPPFIAHAKPTIAKGPFSSISILVGYQSGIIYLPACFFKKSCFDQYGSFDLSYQITNDYELFLRFASKGLKYWYVNAVLATMHWGGMSSKITTKMGVEFRRAFYHYRPSLKARFIFEFIWYRNMARNYVKQTPLLLTILESYRKLRNSLLGKVA